MTSLGQSRELNRKNQEQKLKQAAQLYEKHFLREMVKAMRSTIKPSSMNAPSMAQKIFAQKLDEQYVEKWGDTGGIGLGDIIFNQLKEKFFSPRIIKPSGPMNIPKGKVHNIPTQGGLNWIFQPENEKGEATTVTNPWSGSVSKVIKGDDSRTTIKIQHDNQLSSFLSFKGLANVKNGQHLATGQRLGELSHLDSLLAWKVTNEGT